MVAPQVNSCPAKSCLAAGSAFWARTDPCSSWLTSLDAAVHQPASHHDAGRVRSVQVMIAYIDDTIHSAASQPDPEECPKFMHWLSWAEYDDTVLSILILSTSQLLLWSAAAFWQTSEYTLQVLLGFSSWLAEVVCAAPIRVPTLPQLSECSYSWGNFWELTKVPLRCGDAASQLVPRPQILAANWKSAMVAPGLQIVFN